MAAPIRKRVEKIMECKNETLKPYKLTGAIQMYEATGEESYKDYAMAWLSRPAALGELSKELSEDIPPQDALAYFFALKQTGDVRYRKRMDDIFEQRSRITELMPFIAAYETAYKRKEHYNEIAAFFRKKDRFTGKDLVSLIETVGQMSEEIYEYYRELRDLFKTAVKDRIKDLPDSGEALEIGYSILKACNIGVLQEEKYGHMAELVNKSMAEGMRAPQEGLWEMFKAQDIIRNKAQQ